MKLSTQTSQYVCISCRLAPSRQQNGIAIFQRERNSSVKCRRNFQSDAASCAAPNSAQNDSYVKSRRKAIKYSYSRSYSTEPPSEPISEPLQLSSKQMSQIGQIESLRKKLKHGLETIPESEKSSEGVPIETLLKKIAGAPTQSLISVLSQVYAGKPAEEVQAELNKITLLRRPDKAAEDEKEARDILEKLKIVDNDASAIVVHAVNAPKKSVKTRAEGKKARIKEKAIQGSHRRKTKIRRITAKPATSPPATNVHSTSTDKAATEQKYTTFAKRERTKEKFEHLKMFEAALLSLQPVDSASPLKVPKLSYDLSRVLFNPGVYQLQDPRSRVYNFDPYLEQLMPIEEFNFDALNKYTTASEDATLQQLAKTQDKKYIGSTSSMSGALSQFHFLLSVWRPLTARHLSEDFDDSLNTFTVLARAPSAIFLRWKDGTYAVDADKQFDTANVLMELGQSMEKLLTLNKEDFELYRRKSDGAATEDVEVAPEAFHYSTLGDFLFRSQLDAHDERLPGTGMFDLKTRAVAGVRNNINDWQVGKGYQIKDRFGKWESYEREYFDMMRSTFLKYSLQVRMGRMDGIFVAYHNTARIFGFQYVPISELDLALHGQSDRTLGDQEFGLSAALMNEVFNMATEEFPARSIRFHFESREPSKTQPFGYMQIFAEAMEEDDIQSMQNASKERIRAWQKKMLDCSPLDDKSENVDANKDLVNEAERVTTADSSLESEISTRTPSTQESTAADTEFLDRILSPGTTEATEPKQPDSLAAWTLHIYNEVNGSRVERPENLTSEDRWTVKYEFERLSTDKARSRYASCKNRRRTALDMGNRVLNSPFHRHLRQLSLQGAVWREQQDTADTQRDQVVLYKPGVS